MNNKNIDIIKKIRDIKFRLYYLSIFKVKTFIRRKLGAVLKFNRPASLPYITGDGFRTIADHVFDEISEVDFSSVQHGDIVFVRADLLHTYFEKIHPNIKNRYILISHNSDQNITADFTKYIDEKIIHWFAQNALIAHPKITPIPIGLMLRLYDRKNQVVELLKFNKNKAINTTDETTDSADKAPRIFYSFSEETNTKRSIALDVLKKSDICLGSTEMLARSDYYANINKYMFNASPEGGGVDCHRTWESMHLGAIPVLEKNTSTEYWQKIGLPVLLINSWNEISTIDVSKLEEQYAKMKGQFESPALYMEYWISEIIKYKYAE
jgi:hypothetical protein